MKILQIFGAVVAVHLLAFIFIFASPGCQSTPRSTPTPDATMPSTSVPATPAVTYNATVQPMPDSAAGMTAASSVPTVTYAPPLTPDRAAPTRPGSPNAAAITPAKSNEEVAPVTTYTVARGDSLWSIAKKNHLSVAELAAANNLGTSASLQPGKKLIIPGKIVSAGDIPAAPAGPTYKVRPGDSLSAIARRHGVTSAALRAANNLTTDTVRVGQELHLPEGAKLAADTPAPADTAAHANGDAIKHVVQPGESLGVIARKYQVSVGELAAANSITDPGKIRAGQQLVIPGFKPVGAKAADSAADKPAQPAATTPHFDLKPPPAGQDLDAGLKDPANSTAVPTIKVEEPKKIEEPKKDATPPKG
jgi:LysM repeat protein